MASEIEAERWEQVQEAVKVVGELAEVFGLAKEAKLSELLAEVKAAREAQLKAAIADQDKLVDKVIGEMVQADVARPLVKRMLRIDPAAADEAGIKKTLGEMLAQEDIKKALADVFKAYLITPKTNPQVFVSGGNIIKRVVI
ncbi:MAG: hypothetical protein DDT34_02017 [Firmicutes bacterium]|nr:hypothetical protein [Bacillota bacterium]